MRLVIIIGIIGIIIPNGNYLPPINCDLYIVVMLRTGSYKFLSSEKCVKKIRFLRTFDAFMQNGKTSSLQKGVFQFFFHAKAKCRLTNVSDKETKEDTEKMIENTKNKKRVR